MSIRKVNRRRFLQQSAVLTGGGLALTTLSPRRLLADTSSQPPGLGIASYTFRKFDLAQTVEMTRRVGIDQLCLKSFHLELDSTPEQCAEAVARARAAGITVWAGGVITMRTVDQVDQAFRYARAAGMRCIVGVPHPEVLSLVEQRIREYDIAVAIHNHGPGDRLYPLPQDAYDRIRTLDARLGLCIDVGHTERAGGSSIEAIHACADRLLDIHLKDVSAARPEGREIEIGRGVMDIPGILRALLEVNYRGLLSFEYEKDPDDPLPGLAESVGYVRGALAAIRAGGSVRATGGSGVAAGRRTV